MKKPDRLATRVGKPITPEGVEDFLRIGRRMAYGSLRRVVQQLSKDISHSFINCDEINAYRLACQHILQAMKERP